MGLNEEDGQIDLEFGNGEATIVKILLINCIIYWFLLITYVGVGA